MANNEDDIKIVFGAEADESSAEQTGKKLRKSVEKGFGDDGRIKVPVDITVPIDNTKKKLTEAQKDITSEISKMMAKGFSASGKDIDTLTSKFDKFAKALDSAGKGRQNKIFREIRKQVEELQKSYKALQDSQKASRPYETKVKKTDSSRKTKSSRRPTTEDEYYKQQEQYSTRAKGAGEKVEAKRDLKTYYKEGPYLKSSGNIDQTTFNEHEARLSRYSSYGSNWARELNKILKEETAKAIASLVTYIDKDYEIGKDNKLHGKKSGTPTTEAQMISAVYQKVKRDLTASIRQSEAGDESITANTLAQLAAIMKVLNKTLMTEIRGKSLEQAIIKTEEDIETALNKPYDIEESDAIGFTDLKEGEQKGVGPGHENTKKIVAEFHDKLKSWDSEVFGNIKGSLSQLDETLKAVKSSDAYKAELNNLNSTMETVFGAVNDTVRETGNVNRSIKIGNTKEAVEDDAAEKISKEHKDIDRDTARTVKQDAATGFNTDAKANELITLVRSILQQIQGIAPKNKKGEDIKKSQKDTEENVQEIAKDKTPSATSEAQAKNLKDYSMEMQKAWDTYEQSIDPLRAQMALTPVAGTFKNYYEGTDIVSRQRRTKEIEEERKRQLEEASKSNEVQKSTIYASPLRQGFWKSLEGAFEDLTGTTRKYEEVLKANADEQDKMAAERIRTYGLNNGRNPNDTGDIAGMRRILQLYRTNKASIEQNPELAQRIQLTPGREIDTTELTKALNDALSGKNMRNAQMGGSIPRQILGGLTGFIGMPSLEKSRAQADGLNQILGNINKALQSVLINIQTKETELAGMEASGQAKFTKEGYLTPDSTSAAFKTLADLEEEKLVLDSIKADLLANDEIIKRTGGRFSSLVKNLNYTSPVLKENNGILRNINSGLDKNGKALKFQTRMAEILNYTFQLMSRSIGQMIKNWLSMINPINIIKRLFNDFGSYNVKWQRTMNVIKNNFREIILPFMDKIAQTLVNIIGFLDIISMKIQEAFGYTPISLFDQENANEFKKTYEEISNVTAGFDELHDIGSSGGENDPDNLLGEIYKPQLSQAWIDLANKIGDLFAGVIKGDLGFGEAMVTILKLLGETLATIGKMLWDWFKETDVGKWLIENWKTALATILGLFLAWKLLKIFGPTLLSTIGNAFKTLLSKVGGWITTLLGASGFGQGIMLAFQSLFAGGKYSLIGTLGEMFTNSAAITQAGSWGSMIGFALVKGLAGVLSIALGGKMVTDAFDSAADKTSYNIGLEQAGGNEEDKKGIGGDVLKGAAGGAAIGFGIGQIVPVIGPLVGAAIGAVAGALTTSLAPAFEAVEVAARNANNEMQKIEYYEGTVQGAKTQVDELTELMNMSNDTLQAQSEKVYALGEKYGVSKTYLDSLVQAMKDGNYNSEMAIGLNSDLMTALSQLDWYYQNNESVTNKLTEAKKKLQQEELNLAIAQDISAGNFELATARIEYAMASGLYTTEEAAKKMAAVLKETSYTEGQELLKNVSPELEKKFTDYNEITTDQLRYYADKFHEASTEERTEMLNNFTPEIRNKFLGYLGATEEFKRDYIDYYNEANEEVKRIITDPDVTKEMEKAGEKNAEALRKGLQNATTWDKFRAWWADVLPGGKTSDDIYIEVGSRSTSLQTASYAVGTNYVPNDGLAYLHQGEAVIPKKYNQPYQPVMSSADQATMYQMMSTLRSLDNTMKQGIAVNGRFVQRGSDLVAVVNKTNSRTGADVLSNVAYAR